MAKSYPKVNYVDDAGVSHPIRIELGDVTAQPTAAPTGAPTSGLSARVGGSSRKLGLRARFVSLTRTATAGTGAGTVTRQYTTRLAILKLADFTALTKGGAITVNGVAYTISSKTGESQK